MSYCSVVNHSGLVLISSAVALAFSLVSPALTVGVSAPLTGGGIETLPPVQTAPVPLANASFEDGAASWKINIPESFSIAPSQAHNGKASLRFDATCKPQYTPSAKLIVHDIQPGNYVLRFWIKTRALQGMQVGGSERTGGIRVSFEYTTSDGQRSWPSSEIFTGTRDWQPEELLFHIERPPRDHQAAISINSYNGSGGQGEAWLDDFTLERWATPPVEAFLRYPNYRGFLAEDASQTVKVWVRVNQEQPATPVQISITDATGAAMAEQQLPANTQETVVLFEAGKWPLGNYVVRVKRGSFQYPAYLIRKISPSQRRGLAVWFDADNVAHLAGKPTFPIGFYNAGASSDIARLDMLKESPANFTIDYQSWPLNLVGRRQYLGELQKRNLPWFLDTINMVFPKMRYNILEQPIGKELLPQAVDTQENMDRFLTRLAQEVRSLPGHGGWYVMDERPLDRIPPTFHNLDILRREDPGHPTYGVSNKPEEFFYWRDTLDVFGLDPYPLMNMAAGQPLSLVGQWTRTGNESVQGARPLWTVIQFFQGWAKDRWPTEEELRSMSLMAIVEGARGLWYWSFGARGLNSVKDPQQRAEYWRRAVKVTRELQQLEPALIAPDAPEMVRSVSDSRLRWRARATQGKRYVFAYLPADKFNDRTEIPPVEVQFTLHDGQIVKRTFRPDTADWLEIKAK